MSLFCQGCSKALRNSEGIKCTKCDSRFHVKCAEGRDSHLESGDRKYHWICATCKRPTSKTNINAEQQALLNAINVVTEKMELINKIQLPKLNNDLMQVKLLTDRLSKQNDDISQKIDGLKKELERKRNTSLQRRHINVSPRSPRSPKLKDADQPTTLEDKFITYRTRRRSYPLMKILMRLNRRLLKTRSPKK